MTTLQQPQWAPPVPVPSSLPIKDPAWWFDYSTDWDYGLPYDGQALDEFTDQTGTMTVDTYDCLFKLADAQGRKIERNGFWHNQWTGYHLERGSGLVQSQPLHYFLVIEPGWDPAALNPIAILDEYPADNGNRHRIRIARNGTGWNLNFNCGTALRGFLATPDVNTTHVYEFIAEAGTGQIWRDGVLLVSGPVGGNGISRRRMMYRLRDPLASFNSCRLGVLGCFGYRLGAYEAESVRERLIERWRVPN